MDEDLELPPWNPTGLVHLDPPLPRPIEDQRWRPFLYPEQLPTEPRERTRKAIEDQCMNGRIPGYKGFIPSARAEDVYGCTSAIMGRAAADQNARRQQQRLDATTEAMRSTQEGGRSVTPTSSVGALQVPDEHPLGKSRAAMLRNYWVPSIPGYGGFVPGKHCENVCGGGVASTCAMAGKAIAERKQPTQQAKTITLQDDVQRGRVRDFYHDRRRMPAEMEPSSDHNRLAVNLRAHCERQIPGYMGHVPRIHGNQYMVPPKLLLTALLQIYARTRSSTQRITSAIAVNHKPQTHGN